MATATGMLESPWPTTLTTTAFTKRQNQQSEELHQQVPDSLLTRSSSMWTSMETTTGTQEKLSFTTLTMAASTSTVTQSLEEHQSSLVLLSLTIAVSSSSEQVPLGFQATLLSMIATTMLCIAPRLTRISSTLTLTVTTSGILARRKLTTQTFPEC